MLASRHSAHAHLFELHVLLLIADQDMQSRCNTTWSHALLGVRILPLISQIS